MTARFVPVDIGADVSALPESERRALVKMIDAARVLDGLYLRQVWAGNEALLLELLADRSPLGQARLHAFLVNRGPWSQLDRQAPFLPGVPAKPEAANFYPAGATKAEVEAWMKALPESRARRRDRLLHHDPPHAGRNARERALQRRVPGRARADGRAPARGGGRDDAADAAGLPREARRGVPLERLLRERRRLDGAGRHRSSPRSGPTRPTTTAGSATRPPSRRSSPCGTRRRRRSSPASPRSCSGSRTACRSTPALRNPKLGGMAPIRVVDVVFSSGQGNSGVQTAAYNLPNDERVVAEKGSKRVMLKNTQRAKFDHVLLPISKVALAPADQPNVDFEAFFTHILMHELMHGLGPGNIRVAGRDTTVRLELKDTYGAIEEAKADISGLWALQQLVDKGVLDRSLRADDVHDLPRLGLPLDPLRHRRGPRQGAGPPAQRPPRQGGVPGRSRRHLRGRSREGEAGGHRPHPRAHDAAGRGQLREGEGPPRAPGRRPSRDAAGPRPAARTCRWTSSRAS